MVKVIHHSDLNQTLIGEIIGVKSLSWKYSFEEHLQWMDENLLPTDMHFMLYNSLGELISYMNLVEVNVIINNENFHALGVGNVCTRMKGKGNGKMLMIEINRFLVEKGCIGILFCKTNLISFYEQFEWKKTPSKNLNLHLMILNFKGTISNIIYTERTF